MPPAVPTTTEFSPSRVNPQTDEDSLAIALMSYIGDSSNFPWIRILPERQSCLTGLFNIFSDRDRKGIKYLSQRELFAFMLCLAFNKFNNISIKEFFAENYRTLSKPGVFLSKPSHDEDSRINFGIIFRLMHDYFVRRSQSADNEALCIIHFWLFSVNDLTQRYSVNKVVPSCIRKSGDFFRDLSEKVRGEVDLSEKCSRLESAAREDMIEDINGFFDNYSPRTPTTTPGHGVAS